MALTSTEGERDLPRWFETFFAIIQRIEIGTLEIALPDGRVFAAEGARPGPQGRIDVHEREFFSRMAREGELGFGEMYIEGWWTTPDLQAVLDVCLLNNENISRRFPGQALVRAFERLRHWLRANTRRGARKNISFHYDLGNAFYAEWLDPTMTYSSALFSGQGESLTEAQTNKYAAICERAGLKPGDHVLEIGCGWGGFAEYAIREHDVTVTGLTLSREQKTYAEERLARAGLADRAEIALRDYRDETGVYDRIVSIEMFEAVGEKYWPTFFGTLRDRLKPGGQAALQVITVAEHLFAGYRNSTDFVQKYIFPGGMLPTASELRVQSARVGLEVVGSTEFGSDYSRTLRLWADRFAARWPQIRALGFDEGFRRTWCFYLASCAACFAAETTDVTQISLRKPA